MSASSCCPLDVQQVKAYSAGTDLTVHKGIHDISSGEVCRVRWRLDAIDDTIGASEAETETSMGQEGERGLRRTSDAGKVSGGTSSLSTRRWTSWIVSRPSNKAGSWPWLWTILPGTLNTLINDLPVTNMNVKYGDKHKVLRDSISTEGAWAHGRRRCTSTVISGALCS